MVTTVKMKRQILFDGCGMDKGAPLNVLAPAKKFEKRDLGRL